MLSKIIIYTFIIFLIFFHTYKVKTFMNPNFLIMSTWLIILLVYDFFFKEKLGEIDNKIYYWVLSGIFSFYLGVNTQKLFKKKIIKEKYKIFNYKKLKYLTYFNIFLFVLYLRKLFQLTNYFYQDKSIFERIKLIHGYQSSNLGIFQNYLLYLSVVWIFLNIIYIKKKMKFNIYYLLNFLLGIIYFLLVGKRMILLIPILSLCVAKVLTYKWTIKNQIKSIMFCIAFFSFTLVYFSLLKQRFTSESTQLINALIPYFGMPLKNLDIIVKEKLYQNTYIFPNFFRFFFVLYNKIFNEDIYISEVVKGYIIDNEFSKDINVVYYYANSGNYVSNLHTALYTFLEDLNFKGIVFFQFLLGNIFGFIFIRRFKLVYFILYCIWIEVIIIQYAQDNFFPFLSLRIQQIIYLLIIHSFLFKKGRKTI